ncbi:ranBP-type and C3HC4-type zinc finger-containing protein 1-like [Corythoichthys intestinalis]|uniref:ranBP-type and C3HC4-type zinc finger-containing protein 1-like n=1 Tax=Corythoichthys intestinalis TaxID=161448 RepID=UPI0025A53575|nr:ranBP-type and C3HC4-type zinc finger-containing protein 1-like [Corythoichthys intestinalis]
MSDLMTLNSTLEEAEELAKRLSEALSVGNEEEASTLSRKLCRLSLPVCVSIERMGYTQDSIKLSVGVEYAQSEDTTPLTVVVSCGMTISQLKDEIHKNYGFSQAVQHWVIGKRLARDDETLYSHGIRRHGDQAFLFIRFPQAMHPKRQQQHNLQNRLEGLTESREVIKVNPEGNDRKESSSEVVPSAPPPPSLLRTPSLLRPPPPPKPPKRQTGWACPRCTFINQPTRPGCRQCSEERPRDYSVPEAHKPVGDEAVRIHREAAATFLFKEFQVADQLEALQMLQTDNQPETIDHIYTSLQDEPKVKPRVPLRGIKPGKKKLRKLFHHPT